MLIASVASVAVYVTAWATPSFTVNVACPLALVVPLTVVIVELPLPAAKVTVLPLTRLPPESLRVTVTVEVATLFATTEVGLATTVEAAALTGPGLKVAVTAWALLPMEKLHGDVVPEHETPELAALHPAKTAGAVGVAARVPTSVLPVLAVQVAVHVMLFPGAVVSTTAT